MICYSALLIYRLLETKLKEKGYHFTINEILNTLKNMNVCNVENIIYQSTYTSSKVCDALNYIFNFDLDRKGYRPTDLNKKIKKNS